MVIQPKIRGFICTTAHPEGCKQSVLEQIAYVKKHAAIAKGPQKVLVIGASTGYGLASRIVAAFGAKAKTIGVFFEKAAEKSRTASAGWYHSAAFEAAAEQAGLYAKSINGDAFSEAIKAKTIQLIQQDWGGEVDLVIYSLASPRRVHPQTGEVFHSVLKPVGQSFVSKTIDVMNGQVKEIALEPATENEIASTTAVMGGEDWMLWMEALMQAGVLAQGSCTVAYSYIGPTLTYPIYRDGTIGKAKTHLEKTAHILNEKLGGLKGKAVVSVNKAVVTQASAAIPVVPLYISLLYKVMKAQALHETCIEQIYRLFHEKMYNAQQNLLQDEHGLIRLDDWELRPQVQTQIMQAWPLLDTQHIEAMTDLKGYQQDFYRLFGFGIEGVDYKAEVETHVPIHSIPASV